MQSAAKHLRLKAETFGDENFGLRPQMLRCALHELCLSCIKKGVFFKLFEI